MISRFLASTATANCNTGRSDWNFPDVLLQPVGPTDGRPRPLHLDVTLTTVRTGAVDKSAVHVGAQGAADAALGLQAAPPPEGRPLHHSTRRTRAAAPQQSSGSFLGLLLGSSPPPPPSPPPLLSCRRALLPAPTSAAASLASLWSLGHLKEADRYLRFRWAEAAEAAEAAQAGLWEPHRAGRDGPICLASEQRALASCLAAFGGAPGKVPRG